MRRILLKLKYNGSGYSGWQVQANAISVQQTLQDAAEKTFGIRPPITGCSRTDSGVHANMFCCHFDTESRIPTEKIPFALNRFLPSDISIFGAEEVNKDFHARYSAKAKEYIYKMYLSKHRDPFLEPFALRINPQADVEIMAKYAVQFIRKADFSAFCSAGTDVQDKVRTVFECEINKNDNILVLRICGDGFLYNMVRIIAGTVLDFSLKSISPDKIIDVINSRDRNLAGPTAPAKALYLNRVIY